MMDPILAFVLEIGARMKTAEAANVQKDKTIEEQRGRIEELERQVAAGTALRAVKPEESSGPAA